MSFKSINAGFEEAVSALASVWRDQCNSWNDPKTEEIARNVIIPVSDSCKKLLQQSEPIQQALGALSGAELTSEN